MQAQARHWFVKRIQKMCEEGLVNSFLESNVLTKDAPYIQDIPDLSVQGISSICSGHLWSVYSGCL